MLYSYMNHCLTAVFVLQSSGKSYNIIEPPREKNNSVTVRPAKTQISLGIRPVWSESLLSAWKKLGSLATHWAHSEDSGQTVRMPRLIRVFAGRTCHFVGFVMRRLYHFKHGIAWISANISLG